MKKDLTELVFILDRSGSMMGLESDTIGGFNGTIAKQKKEEGEALVTTYLFNHECTLLHDRLSLDKIPAMTEKEYRVGGSTALIDAIGGAIEHISAVHRYIREEDVPAHTLFVITTDGLENSSRRFSSSEVKAMIEKQKAAGWEFIFLGANIDAVETARTFGIEEDHAVNYIADEEGVLYSNAMVSEAASAVRSGGRIGMPWKRKAEADFNRRKK